MAMKDAEPPVANWKITAAYYSVKMFGRWSIIPREDDELCEDTKRRKPEWPGPGV